jgi:hypothetical protein
MPMLFCTLIAVALLLHGLGPTFLRDALYIVVLPFLLLAFLVWSMTDGERWALPVAVGVASFVVQTHIGYTALAAPLVLLGVGWLIASRIRGDVGAIAGPVLVAGAVLSVLWLPVAYEEWVEAPGNLSRIRDYFADPPAALNTIGDGMRVVLGQFEISPEWFTGLEPPDVFTREPKVLVSLQPPVLLVPLAAAAVLLWRWRTHAMRKLLAVLAAMATAGVVSVARTIGPVYYYRLRWALVVGAVAGVVMLRGAWEALGRFAGERVARRCVPATLVILVALSAIGAFRAVGADLPEPAMTSAATRTLAAAVVRQLPARDGAVVVRSESFGAFVFVPGMVRQLEKQGVTCRILSESLGDHRRLGTEPVRQRLLIAVDGDVDVNATRTDLHLIGYFGDLSFAERRARVRELPQRPPEERLRAAAALGSAVAVFAEDEDVARRNVESGT